MERADLLKDINEIFCDVLDDEDIVISEISSAKDVEDWDSLSHIHIVVAVEKHFKIKFNSAEISNWKDISEMIDSVEKRLE